MRFFHYTTVAAMLGLLTLTGCARPTGVSYESLPPQYHAQLADLAVSTAASIALEYPQKLIYVDTPGKNDDTFGACLRRELAQSNTLAITPEMADVRVRYALEELSPTQGYINLRYSDGRAQSKTFMLAALSPANTAPAESVSSVPLQEQEIAVSEAVLPDTSVQPASRQVRIQKAYGHTPTLKEVVEHTIYPGWRYSIAPSKAATSVSAPGNIFWKDAINTAASEAGCYARIDAERKYVTIEPVESATAGAAVADAALSTVSASTSSIPSLPVASSQIQQPPVPVHPEWILTQGSLRAQLETWVAQAGHQLIWDTNMDLDMQAGASFQGSFPTAIAQLFEGLHEAGHPLTATIYQGNNVLVVGDK